MLLLQISLWHTVCTFLRVARSDRLEVDNKWALLLQISLLWHTVCRLCTFNSQAIWKVKAEGKLHFFAWLFVQGKIQTADNLLLKGIHCEPVCCLCAQDMETAAHLCLHCCYAWEVWCLVHSWSQGLVGIPVHDVDIQDWWNSTLQATCAENKSRAAALLIYMAWNIWNERNRRIFQGISQTPARILGLIKEEMAIRRLL